MEMLAIKENYASNMIEWCVNIWSILCVNFSSRPQCQNDTLCRYAVIVE